MRRKRRRRIVIQVSKKVNCLRNSMRCRPQLLDTRSLRIGRAGLRVR